MEAALYFLKKRLFLAVAAALLVVGGGFYLYYNSEAMVLKRLARDNPQSRDLLDSINRAKTQLAESKDNKLKVEALLDIAVAKTALGDLKGAVDAYSELLKINPTHNIAHENLASIYVTQGRYDKAEIEYLTVIATQPHLIDPYLRLADLYLAHMKEKKNVVPAVLTFGMNQNGKHPALLEKLIQYYFDRELYLLAGEQADELLKIDPGNAFAKDILSQIEARS